MAIFKTWKNELMQITTLLYLIVSGWKQIENSNHEEQKFKVWTRMRMEIDYGLDKLNKSELIDAIEKELKDLCYING